MQHLPHSTVDNDLDRLFAGLHVIKSSQKYTTRGVLIGDGFGSKTSVTKIPSIRNNTIQYVRDERCVIT